MNLLSVLRHLNYQPWFALAEFVDNALQSYLVNKEPLQAAVGPRFQLKVEIVLEDDRLIIRDNAAGISLADFPRAFRAAEVPPDRSQLAEFGIGMKAAACWFSPVWHVRTSALGDAVERSVRFDIGSITRDSIEELEVREVETRPGHHFTEVVLEELHKPLHGRTIAKVKEHLSDIYREFFRSGELTLAFNGEPLEYRDPNILVAPYHKDPNGPTREWRKPIDFDFGLGMKVRGFAAIRERAKTSGAGFALFRRRRLIQGSGDDGYRPERIFGKPNDYRYQRVFGELHLEGFKVSHTKDGIVWEEHEEEFLELLDDHLRSADLPLLQQAIYTRFRKNVRDVRELGQTAVNATAEAIEVGLPVALEEASVEAPSENVDVALAGATDISTREITVERDGVTWQVQIELTYDPAIGDWFSFSDSAAASPSSRDAFRRLGIRVAMMHPFMDAFCHADRDQIEALLRVAAALAIAEMIARDAGVRQAGTIRREVNRLLRDALSRR